MQDDETPDFFEEHDEFGFVIPKATIPIAPEAKQNKQIDLDVTYAGLGIRVFAYLIDFAILLLPILFADKLLFGVNDPGSNYVAKSGLLNLIIWGLYYAFTESSDSQATFGKRICHLKVIDEEGKALSFRKAYWHLTLQVISILPLGFGIWAIAKDPKKQAWHDMIIGSYVIIDKGKTLRKESVGTPSPASIN